MNAIKGQAEPIIDIDLIFVFLNEIMVDQTVWPMTVLGKIPTGWNQSSERLKSNVFPALKLRSLAVRLGEL